MTLVLPPSPQPYASPVPLLPPQMDQRPTPSMFLPQSVHDKAIRHRAEGSYGGCTHSCSYSITAVEVLLQCASPLLIQVHSKVYAKVQVGNMW